MLDIIIVSFNCRDVLAGCLRSLASAPPLRPHRIVVVDNGSTDGTVAYVRASHPEVHVIEPGGNIGFAAANNIAIRATAGDLVLLLNPDTVVTPAAIDRLCQALESSSRAGVAGPRIVDGTGRAELSFGRMLSPLNEWRQKRRTAEWIATETAREQVVDWVSGACLLVHRADAERAGLLDERFFLYTEDVDFCHAVRRQGRKVLFTPVATITHLRGRSRASRPEASQRAYRASHVAFYEKHHPFWAPVLKLYLRMRREWPA